MKYAYPSLYFTLEDFFYAGILLPRYLWLIDGIAGENEISSRIRGHEYSGNEAPGATRVARCGILDEGGDRRGWPPKNQQLSRRQR